MHVRTALLQLTLNLFNSPLASEVIRCNNKVYIGAMR